MAPQVGREFGGYRIDAEIGRGGMGAVYRAHSRRIGRSVALKVLHADVANDPGYRERFTREAAALARLDSPHVIQILDHGEVDGSLFLAMQLVDGPDLDGLLTTGPLPPRRALGIVAQIASALGDAQAVGVVHRDVKPANVLLRRAAAHHDEDFAYLCDFGIARADAAADGPTPRSGVVGTLGYLAPERLHGAPASTASDVYSLGCLLWTVLVGTPPYRGAEAQVLLAHVNAPIPQLVEDGPRTAAVNALIAELMAKDPARRPDVRRIRERIRSIIDDRTGPGPARPVVAATVPEQQARPERRRRPLLLGAAAVLLVVAAVITGFALTAGPSAQERLTAATPAGLTDCRSVDPGPDDVAARLVCPVPGAGELRISALGSAGAAQEALGVLAGRDPALLAAGTCPRDLPARQDWSVGEHTGTLICLTTGTNTRYAWSDTSTATVSVLDGAPGQVYPADLGAVADFVADLRFG